MEVLYLNIAVRCTFSVILQMHFYKYFAALLLFILEILFTMPD